MTQILLAEDDRISRVMLQAVLQKWGYRVVSVPNGNEALERLLDPSGPSVAILDWMMPMMTGVEVCRKLRATTGLRPMHIMLLTAKSTGMEAAESLAAGADDHLSKPYNLVELQARIELGIRRISASSSVGPGSDLPEARQAGEEFCLGGCLPRFLPLNRIALGAVLEHPDLISDTGVKGGVCDLDIAVQMSLLNARNMLHGRIDPVWEGKSLLVDVSAETVGQILLNLLIFLRGAVPGPDRRTVRLENDVESRKAVLRITSDFPDLPGVAIDRLVSIRHGSDLGHAGGFGPFFARIAAESVGGSLALRARSEGGIEMDVRLPLAS